MASLSARTAVYCKEKRTRPNVLSSVLGRGERLQLHKTDLLVTKRAGPNQRFLAFAGGARATAASLVSSKKVNVSSRYSRTALSVWLR
jgi:hypothetical protein